MSERTGARVSVAACLLFLAGLAWPYAVESPAAVTTYYQWGGLSPLFAGVLVSAVLAAFVAGWRNYGSPKLSVGVAVGTSLVAAFVTSAWAATARLDVFRASGWALPAHRFVLVGCVVLVVLGAVWHAWTNGLLPTTGALGSE